MKSKGIFYLSCFYSKFIFSIIISIYCSNSTVAQQLPSNSTVNKNSKFELDKFGNIIKDIEKGVLSVKYLNVVTKELNPDTNTPLETTNYLPAEIKFIDLMTMKYDYNENNKIIKISLIHNNINILELDKSTNVTYGNSNQIGKFLYEVNFVGGRAIPDFSDSKPNSINYSSYIYDFTSKDLKNKPSVYIENIQGGLSVNYDYKGLDANKFNYEDFIKQRKKVFKYDTLQKGYYFNNQIFKLKAYMSRHFYGDKYVFEDKKIFLKSSYTPNPNFGAHDFNPTLPIHEDVSAIDIFDKIEVFDATSEGYIEVIGMFNGEYHANTEMYIHDSINQKIWLGRDFQSGNDTSNKKQDSNFMKIRIIVDSNFQFKGINNGTKFYSVTEWNEKYKK